MNELIFSNIFLFTQRYNIILGIITSILAFLVAFQAVKIYLKTLDKRMLIIAAGFILGGAFQILHFINSYVYGVQFFYVFFENLSYSGAIFISLFLNKNNITGKKDSLDKKVLIFSLVYFSLVILFKYLLTSQSIVTTIPFSSLEIVFAAWYFLLALIFFDRRLSYKLQPISALPTGLFLFSLSQIYIITPAYLTSIHVFISHINFMVALFLMLLGINDFSLKTESLNSRHRLLIYSSLVLLTFYFILILGGEFIFQIHFLNYLKYYFLLFFIINVMIQYILSRKVVETDIKPMKSIKITFIITTLSIITIMLLIQSFISIYIFKTYTENETKNYLRSRIELEANKLNSQIIDIEITNRLNAATVKNFDTRALAPIIKNDFEINPLMFGSGIWLEPNIYRSGLKYYGPYWYKDKNGNIKFTLMYSTPQYNYFKHAWYKNGFIPGAKAVWSEPYFDRLSKSYMMTVTSPIHRQNKIIGVFSIDVELADFQNYVSKIKVGTKGYAFIVSNKGYYVSYKEKITEEKDLDIKRIGEKIVKANKTETARAFINKEDFFIVYTPIGNTKLKMVFVLPTSEVYFNFNKALTSNIIKYFLAIITFSIIFILLFSKTITKPLNILIETLENVTKGDLSARASIKSKDEMGMFADSLNYMIGSLENIVNRELLLREIISTMMSTLDINEIKRIFVTKIGNFFGADRVAFSEYDSEKNIFLPIDSYSEYVSSPNIGSLIGSEWTSDNTKQYIQKLIELKEINFSDLNEYVKNNNLENSDFEKLFIHCKVKSGFNVLVIYGEKIIGFFCIDFINKNYEIKDDDIKFLKTLTNQAGVAFYQSKLFNKEKQTAKREALLRKIVETIRSSLDINDTLTVICDEVAKLFNVQRAVIIEYPNPQNYKERIIRREYKINPEIKGINDTPYPSEILEYWGCKLLKEGISLKIDNISKSDTPDYFKKSYDAIGQKSTIGFPIKKGGNVWGTLVLSEYNYYRHWTDDEINLLETIAAQVYTAIQQAELYTSTKKYAEREALLRKIIETVRSSLEIRELKNKIVTEIGKAMDADVCAIMQYDRFNQRFLEVDESSQYMASEGQKSHIGFNIEYGELSIFKELFLNQKKELLISDTNNPPVDLDPKMIKILKDLDVQSNYTVFITYGNQFLGILYLNYIKQKRSFAENEISFFRTLATQAGVALKQAELYETQKQSAEKESLLRDIIEKLSSSLDINQIKKNITEAVGKGLNLDRCIILEYDSAKDAFLPVDNNSEYRSSENIKSFVGFDFSIRPFEFIKETGKQRVELFETSIPSLFDHHKEIEPELIDIFDEYKILSGFQIPLYYGEQYLGIIAGHYSRTRDKYSEQEKGFIRTFADQTGIALYQAKLYANEKQAAERESILRNISNKIRSSLDLESVKHEIVNQIGMLLKADKVFFADYDFKTGKYEVSKEGEYRSSEDIKSFVGYDFTAIPGFIESIRNVHLKGKDIIFNDLEKYLDENNLRGTSVEKFYREFGFISSAAINLDYGDLFLGNLVITFENQRNFSDDEINFIKNIVDQSAVAIYQSRLYNKEKQTAEREALLRKIISTIRQTLDLNKIKISFVTEIGMLFNADRSFLTEFDSDKKLFLPTDEYSEYLSSPNIKSSIGDDLEQYKYYMDNLREKQEIIVQNAEDFIEQYHLKELPYKDYVIEYEVKSGIGFPILYGDQLLGILSVQFTTRYHTFTDEELDFIRTLASQAGLAIYQSKLYESVKQSAEKEKLLREIISELKIFQTFDLAYSYILEKMTEIFDADRAVFIEIPEYKYENPSIKYEYIKNKDLSSMINKQIPEPCQQMFTEISNDLKTVAINDTSECHAELEEAQQFFSDNHVKSFIASPFAKYDKEVKVFGILVMCSSKVKIWTPKEIELLKTIVESIVIVLWEIAKLNEINDLRNTFILTLAHDLQVPLVGEKRALEFLKSRPSDQPIGKYKGFIEETLKSNQSLFSLLTRLLESYSYESGRKSLDLVEYDMKAAINQGIGRLKQLAESKSMQIDIDIEKDLPKVKVDKDEIEKALYYLLENAITYTQKNGYIAINSYIQENYVVTCISDNGPGIESEIRDRIFKRYEMAVAIERKIGAGLSLYLTKQIVEAHKGSIFFTTEVGKGTTFCILLPINPEII